MKTEPCRSKLANLSGCGAHAALRFMVLWWGLALSVLADGVPEPGLVMYGQVLDTTTLSPVTYGTLTWTVTPVSGGAPITVSAALTNIGGQYSYRLRVPFEVLLGSTTLSSGALAASASPTSYDRATVFINGTNVASIVTPALSTFTFKSADHGVVERVDLRVALPAGSASGFVDSDGDGVSDSDELRAGTSPHDKNDYLHFSSIRKQTNGTVELNWQGVSTRSYQLLRSADPGGAKAAFIPIRSDIPGVSPLTSFLDTTATNAGPYFYRVMVQ